MHSKDSDQPAYPWSDYAATGPTWFCQFSHDLVQIHVSIPLKEENVVNRGMSGLGVRVSACHTADLGSIPWTDKIFRAIRPGVPWAGKRYTVSGPGVGWWSACSECWRRRMPYQTSKLYNRMQSDIHHTVQFIRLEDGKQNSQTVCTNNDAYIPLSGILFHLSILCCNLSYEIVSSSLNGVAIGG